jgi:radical SAM superfamily enzyme YgiQ (UPF0313 family)
MKRIAFIRPNLGDFRSSDAMTPLVFGILAARTPPDIDTALFDERLEPVPLREDFDLVALTVETFTARRAYEIAAAYRARGIPVVMGGYHPTLLPDEAMEHADALVIGDAEGTWERVLEDAAAQHLRRVYRAERGRGLNDLHLTRGIFAGKRYAPLSLAQFGRGCRFVCEFCSVRAFYGPHQAQRPVDGLIEELAALPRGRPLFFVDDNLFSRRDRLAALLQALIPLRLRWCCQISVDVIRDPPLLDLMARAGCMMVLIGFESLSATNLRQMGKRWNRVAGEYATVVRRFHERDIMVYGTFVFGYDHDGPDALAAAVDFALDSRLAIANFNPLTPTPGTALYERLRKDKRLLYERWWLHPAYRFGQTTFRPAAMSPEQLEEGCYEARRRFYAHSSILKRAISGPGLLRDPFRLGVMLLANWVSRKEIAAKHGARLGAALPRERFA